MGGSRVMLGLKINTTKTIRSMCLFPIRFPSQNLIRILIHAILGWTFFFKALAGFSHPAEIKVINRDTNQELGTLRTIPVANLAYVSATELARFLEIKTFRSDKTQKLVLSLPDHKIIITAFNPFLIVDENVRQLPVDVLYVNNDFIIPIQYLLESLDGLYPRHIDYDPATATLAISSTGANILSLTIEDKVNGILIHISTSDPFDAKKIFTSQSTDWLYIDIYGGIVNESNLPINGSSKHIAEIVPVQVSEETARISLRMKHELIGKQVFTDEDSREILVSLRTREVLDDHILENLEKERQKWRIDTIILDPGHGGKDPGAIGAGGLLEKNATLAIAKRLKKELESRLKVRVLMTRETDTFVPLKARTQFANKNEGKLFISIHANAMPNHRVRGFMTFFLSPAKTDEARTIAQFENQVVRFEESTEDYQDLTNESYILSAIAQSTFQKESEELAAMVQEQLNKKLDIKDLGVHQAGFYVLMGASMPNILIETAFISNRNDEKLLNSESFHQDVAEAVCESVRKFKQKYEKID